MRSLGRNNRNIKIHYYLIKLPISFSVLWVSKSILTCLSCLSNSDAQFSSISHFLVQIVNFFRGNYIFAKRLLKCFDRVWREIVPQGKFGLAIGSQVLHTIGNKSDRWMALQHEFINEPISQASKMKNQLFDCEALRCQWQELMGQINQNAGLLKEHLMKILLQLTNTREIFSRIIV